MSVVWSNKKVFVTGADGFIGSHLAEALVQQGADVTALALYNSMDSCGWLDDVPVHVQHAMNIVRGDVRDAHQMSKLCDGQDVIFHLAALIAIPYSYDAPSSYVQTNVQGTTNILKASLDAGVSIIIHTSTSEVYGTAQFTPITEEHPLQGQSPYSASKIGADMMAESFARSFDMPVVTLRPFNTYGPRQSERAVISTVIRQALDPTCDTIRVGDLTPARDFNFVSDTVAAFMAAASLGSNHYGKTYNAGSGRMVTIQHLVDLVRSFSHCDKPVIQENHRKRPKKSEVAALMADAAKFMDAAEWSSKIPLEDGVLETIDWWRGRMQHVRTGTGYMV